MGKYCMYCGTQLTEEAAFCPSCGKAVADNKQVTNETQPITGNQADIPSKKKVPGIAIAVIIIAALALIAFGVFKVIDNGKTGAAGPEKVVDNFFASIVDADSEKLMECLDPNTTALLETQAKAAGKKSATEVLESEMNLKSLIKQASDLKISDMSVKYADDKESGTVTVNATINGKKDSMEVPVTKKDGRWYVDFISLGFR